QARFSPFAHGAQTAALRRIDAARAGDAANREQLIFDNAPVSTGQDVRISSAGDYRLFAGWRSDPFFCDVEGAKNNLQFTGSDFFGDKDVCSIVLEVPNTALGSTALRLWVRTLVPGTDGRWVQVERGARPAQGVILV